jgi:hypothetical protein
MAKYACIVAWVSVITYPLAVTGMRPYILYMEVYSIPYPLPYPTSLRCDIYHSPPLGSVSSQSGEFPTTSTSKIPFNIHAAMNVVHTASTFTHPS